jgi:hypothetical protein
VAAMHPVEVADGERASRCDARMMKAAKNLHAADYAGVEDGAAAGVTASGPDSQRH